MSADLEQRSRPPADTWTAAVYVGRHRDHVPAGAGVVIDEYRVLTCLHVVQPMIDVQAPGWVTFPKAEIARSVCAVRQARAAANADLAVLELLEPVPAAVAPAPLRTPSAHDLVDEAWWAFGFPSDAPFGAEAHGAIGAPLAWGWVSLHTESRYRVRPGFSGAGLWSPRFQAVVGVLGQAQVGGEHRGDALAITLRQADSELPQEKLGALSTWTLPAAGDTALAAWGWSLDLDKEAVRHWRPRARGVSVDSEGGYRFSGRTVALAEIVSWLQRGVPDRRVLVVTGSPGVGKSAVLGRVVTTADAGVRAVLPVDDDNVKAPLGAVSCAVHVKGKTAMDVAVELARAASVRMPRDLDDLLPSLREELQHRTSDRFNIVVDALDEAASPGHARAILTRILLPLTQTCADVGAQVVIGTRRRDDGGDLIGALGTAAHIIDLDAERYFQHEDLYAYALSTLQLVGDERPNNPYEDRAIAIPLAWRIAELADQNFLIAGLVARTHGMYDVQPVSPEQLVFTATVDTVLSGYLERIPPVGPVAAAEILTALAYAQATGLSIDVWQVMLGALGSGRIRREQLAQFAGSSAANFLIETSADEGIRRYQLFHQALNDALLRGREQRGTRQAEEQAITRHLILLGRKHRWEHADQYLLRALPIHADHADMIDQLLSDDEYLLFADLRRLIPLADRAVTELGIARARLLHLTPRAIVAGPHDRAALFDLTQTTEGLGRRIASNRPAPYRARWASVRKRTERSALEGHTRRVNALCTVRVDDRVLLATASDDWTVRVWDPASASLVFTLRGHTRAVTALCSVWIQERQLLVTAGKDRTVRLWDPSSGFQEQTIQLDAEVTALCAATTAEGQIIAVGDASGSLALINQMTGHRKMIASYYGERITSLCTILTHGVRALAANSKQTTRKGNLRGGIYSPLRILDPGSGKTFRIFDPVSEEMIKNQTSEALSCPLAVRMTDGSVRPALATRMASGTILLTDMSGGKPGYLRVYTPKKRSDGSLEPEPDRSIVAMAEIPTVQGRSLLAVAPTVGPVEIWDPSIGKLAGRLSTQEGQVAALCALTIGAQSILATGGNDGMVHLWDPFTYRESSGETETFSQVVCHIGTGHSPKVAGIRDKSVRLWDTATGRGIRQFQGTVSDLTGLCIVPTRRATLLAASSHDGTIWLWDLETGRAQWPLAAHIGPANAICTIVMRGQFLIATAHNSSSILLWDAVRRKRAGQGAIASLRGIPQRLTGHSSAVRTLAPVTINGAASLASADDNMLCLWDLRTGVITSSAIAPSRHLITSVTHLRVDGRDMLATGGTDNKIVLWDCKDLTRRLTLDGHTDTVTSLCTIGRGDKTLFASASLDRTIRLWTIDDWATEMVIPVNHPAIACVNSAGYLIVGTTVGLIAVDLDPS